MPRPSNTAEERRHGRLLAPRWLSRMNRRCAHTVHGRARRRIQTPRAMLQRSEDHRRQRGRGLSAMAMARTGSPCYGDGVRVTGQARQSDWDSAATEALYARRERDGLQRPDDSGGVSRRVREHPLMEVGDRLTCGSYSTEKDWSRRGRREVAAKWVPRRSDIHARRCA